MRPFEIRGLIFLIEVIPGRPDTSIHQLLLIRSQRTFVLPGPVA
jgi:hypothetical protein